MYDPEEATKEESAMETDEVKQEEENEEEEEEADQGEDGTAEAEEEPEPEPEPEPKKVVPATPVRQTRTAAASTPVSNVKNGAGPKSKKARK